MLLVLNLDVLLVMFLDIYLVLFLGNNLGALLALTTSKVDP